MYFSTIQNSELQYFHGLKVPNFTIKLSDILHQTSNAYDNKLFKIEEIVTDKLYRIYPLFYTGTITSSNSGDKIIADKVIICQKLEEETYITFISDETEPVQDYISYGDYFSIGDTLTTNQFNSIVSLLRANTVHKDSFRINESIQGVYGKYEFDIDDVSFLDTGILITSDTITAEPKVRLTGNVFRWSTYTLKLTVFHYTDVNILDDVAAEDFKVTETVEVELTPDTWVDIPVEDLDEGYIISFDTVVEITHDKPEIHMINGIEVSSSTPIIQSGETADIYAQLLDHDGREYNINDAAGKTVYFYERLEPTITVTAEKSIIQTSDTVDISAKVVDSDGSKPKNAKVYFYKETEE